MQRRAADSPIADPRPAIARRLEASSDAELIAAATRWREISPNWMSEVFTDGVKHELAFYEHFAGYRDPYKLFELARARSQTLDDQTGEALVDYAIAVMGVFEMVEFNVGDVVAIPDPWEAP
jgi:hypothetical protein